MNFSEVRSLVRLRRPVLDPVERTLSRCVTVDDVRTAAHRRWPAGVRGYVEGGADGEVSLRRNRQAFSDYALRPFTLRDVSRTDLTTTLLGSPASAPLALGPTGYTRMMHSAGERAVARAARTAGVPYTLSTMATTSIEDVARDVPGELWFQLYVWRDRQLMRELLARAQDSGYRVLMLTVDTPVTGLRVRDAHHGFTIPPQLSPRTVFDMARHPGWCLRMLSGPMITFANINGDRGQTPSGVMQFAASQFDDTVTWEDLAEIRQLWPGPLVVKGLLRTEDAVRAADAGVDAVVLSNHGGRQLDQTVAPLHALPEVVDALQGRAEVLVDSGVRRGTDIAIALALGASAVLIGRPYLYGLGAGGEQGVSAVIGMLCDELRRAMQLLGVSTVEELRREGPGLVRRVARPETADLPVG
ncbi:alpha-hydroxy-acid oxidizing protein [Planosporangium thailandense]|uniref:Alpha-hydroxy-acid oxidizing protein n=1 Tax=Planosporangium thailandense TaxID=765197 RepID=A0ABX0XZ77_9ACTN|nr:alpha-hydroxy acid oxidase [Planosporangium thailandense]NJC71384.1 alpha-hydroxy-acid oxidizing protein [Planosporangium thailandense]